MLAIGSLSLSLSYFISYVVSFNLDFDALKMAEHDMHVHYDGKAVLNL